MSENHLIFYTSTNQKGKSDSSGAFEPESMNLLNHLVNDDNNFFVVDEPIKTRWKLPFQRRNQVLKVLNRAVKYDHVYFLCHGWKKKLQLGYKGESGAKKLVSDLLKNSPNLRSITFYCCSVAKDTDNFCEWVYKALREGSTHDKVQVFGHYSGGHCCMNPNIKIYTGNNGGTDYIWSKNPVEGFEQLNVGDRKEANKRMHDIKDPFRFEVPFLEMDEQVTTENKCKITFECDDQRDCVYKSGDDCKYMNPDIFCESKTAQVNALTLELEKLTGEL